MKYLIGSTVVMALSSTVAVAQQATILPQASAPVPAITTPANAVTLPAGTPVALRTLEELTTKEKRVKVGQRFNLEVSEAVMLNDHVVIPVGSRAIGEVTTVRNKGMWGKSGSIEARLLYVRANGRQIRLSGTMNDKGVTGTAGVVGAVALLPVAGFFMTGTSATIASGAPAKAFTDEDLPVTFDAPVETSPMVIPATTPTTPAEETL